METTIFIDSRYNGPPDTGNGGYVCGVVAGFIEGVAEVTLRKPPPLDTLLAIRSTLGGEMQLLDGETLIAQGRPATLALDVPHPPTLEEARTAAKHYTGFHYHIFPTCFVCGPERPSPDGLHIYPGRAAGYNQVASPWLPADDLGDENGRVLPQYVWAALDCPGAFAVQETLQNPIVLGRLTAHLPEPILTNQEYIVTGWHIGQDGRKYYAGTAIHDQDGRLCALAQATWIVLTNA